MQIVSKIEKSQLVWCPVDGTDTLYHGQVVKSGGDGVLPMGAAGGIADTDNKGVPYGVVVGTSNKTPVYNSTYGEYITAAHAQASQVARDWTGVEGMWSKGDPQAMVLVARINPLTKIKANFYYTDKGTAITECTVTTGDTDGYGYTANATQFTPVADLATSYCRKGLNRGLYRISDDATTTARTFDRAFPYDIVIGDVFVSVPARPIGLSYVQFDTESTFIDAAVSPASNYYVVNTERLDLSEKGKEYIIFTFTGDHFSFVRA